MVRAYERRERRIWERTAWLAAKIMNVSGKRLKQPITVNKLLGRVVASSSQKEKR